MHSGGRKTSEKLPQLSPFQSAAAVAARRVVVATISRAIHRRSDREATKALTQCQVLSWTFFM